MDLFKNVENCRIFPRRKEKNIKLNLATIGGRGKSARRVMTGLTRLVGEIRKLTVVRTGVNLQANTNKLIALEVLGPSLTSN